jgi:hypothetical protein
MVAVSFQTELGNDLFPVNTAFDVLEVDVEYLLVVS